MTWLKQVQVYLHICSSRYAYIRQLGEFGLGGEKSKDTAQGLSIIVNEFELQSIL